VAADADYFIINRYGEETLYRLLLAVKAGDLSRVEDLPNLAFRTNATKGKELSHLCLFDGPRYRINQVANEDHVPGCPMIDFRHIGQRFIREVVHVRTSSSCPFHCRFCTFPHLQGKFILFDPDHIIVQLKQLKDMGVKYLFFIDDTFNVPLKRFEKLLDRMIQEKLTMQWVSFFRPQFATLEIVRKMFEAGCRMVFCGFESGNDKILNGMNKHVTLRQYYQGLDFLDRAGIAVAASYIIGYPGETYETAMDTLSLINDPRITFSRGGVFYYDPDAPVGKLAKDYHLTGFGAEWRHYTMNSHEAAKIHLEMINKLKSVNVPISDGGVWSLFYLHCCGLGLPDLQALYQEFNQIQRAQIQEFGEDAFQHYRIFGKRYKKLQGQAATTYSGK
jgi:p-methyltransferase